VHIVGDHHHHRASTTTTTTTTVSTVSTIGTVSTTTTSQHRPSGEIPTEETNSEYSPLVKS
jgi:hypothetical protein